MSVVLQEIIAILVAGITTLGQGIGQGLQTVVTSVFLTGEGTQASPYALSTFGGIVALFGGIALAVGLTTLVVKWIMSLGARN